MFSRKPNTVASVMASFTRAIDDLTQIAQDNMARTIVLEEQRALIHTQIETADAEVIQAKLVISKLSDLCGLDNPA